jgi:Glycosyl transferase family 2
VSEPIRFDVVTPTVGRPSLATMLLALDRSEGPRPASVFVVDDRMEPVGPLSIPALPHGLAPHIRVVRSAVRGPAGARNTGWRAGDAEWVAFLDDDVVPSLGWLSDLQADLAGLPADVAASQGRIHVPLPEGRRPTDWERNVKGLEVAMWATADMAYRRSALAQVGGFDERFPRAYREDADLGLRVVDAGYRIVRGGRHILHPVRPAGPWVSIRLQAGNADDAMMRVKHGPRWRERAGVARGRRPRHLAVAATGMASLGGALTGSFRMGLLGAAAWLAGTAELAWARIGPGPRTAREIMTVVATSVPMPFAATYHWLRGLVRAHRVLTPRGRPLAASSRPTAGTVP